MDNLSKSRQSPKLSAAEGERMAQKTIATLQTLRDEAKLDLFWERLLAQQSSLDVDAPELP